MIKKTLESFPWSIGVAFGAMVFFAGHPEFMFDLRGYRDPINAVSTYHPYYARWFFQLLAAADLHVVFLSLSLLTILSLYFSLRVFGGRHWVVFISYQLFWLFFYGQFDGIVVGGLALAYWAVEKKKPVLLGLGLTLAMLKPQLSAFLMILFWWWSPSRWKSLIIPTLMMVISFIQWGFWVPSWVLSLFGFKEIFYPTATNISLWPVAGPWVLLIWPIICLLPLDRKNRIIAVTAGTMISVPYFPIYSSLVVLPMQIPVIAYALFQVSALMIFLGPIVYDFLKIVPVIILGWAIYKGSDWKNFVFPTFARKQPLP